MQVFFELLAFPERTLTAPEISKRLNLLVGIAAVLAITAVDFVMMFRIGHVEGGNPCLWFIIGGMLDLEWVRALSPTMKWVVLYPIKIAGDAGLILLPAWIGGGRWNPEGVAGVQPALLHGLRRQRPDLHQRLPLLLQAVLRPGLRRLVRSPGGPADGGDIPVVPNRPLGEP
jgi:hypothetical protein